MLDQRACAGTEEQVDNQAEKKCPDCVFFDSAMAQIATDENLAPVMPKQAPVSNGPKQFYFRRSHWSMCGHLSDAWTDIERLDNGPLCLEEEERGSCPKCCLAHPWDLAEKQKAGELEGLDPWGVLFQDVGFPAGLPAGSAAAGEVAPPDLRPPPAPAGYSQQPVISRASPMAPKPLPVRLPNVADRYATRSPPTQDESLYRLSPPPGMTSYYAEDVPAEPAEALESGANGEQAGLDGGRYPPQTSAARRINEGRTGQPQGAPERFGHDPARTDEDLAEESDGPEVIHGESDSDGEEDIERPRHMSGALQNDPPGNVSALEPRGRQRPLTRHQPQDLEVEYQIEPEERIHGSRDLSPAPIEPQAPPNRSSEAANASAVEPPAHLADEGEEMTPDEAKRYNLPAGHKVVRKLPPRSQEEARARVKELVEHSVWPLPPIRRTDSTS